MRMNCMSCSTTISALLRLISRTSSAVLRTSSCVMPAAGSSSRISSGSVESTSPSSTHCRWPCASWPTSRSAAETRPIRSSISSTSALAFSPRCRRLTASQMFSRTERPSNTFGTCVLMPMPSRAISCAWALEMSLPRNSTWPWVGSSWPVSILKKVLLPAPFGPIRQRSSPSSKLKSTLRTARTPPKCMLRSRVCNSGSAIALLRRRRFEPLGRAPAAQTQQRQAPIAKRRHDPLRHQEHERDQDHPEDQGRIAENRRADKIAPIGEQAAGETGQCAADRERRKLVGARIITQQLGAPLVLADADDDAAEPACEQQPQSEIGHKQRAGRKVEHAFEIDRRGLIAGKIERRDAGDAVEAD